MPDIPANSTALAPLFDDPPPPNTKKPNETLEKDMKRAVTDSEPVVISLNETFDPPNIDDVVYTGSFSAPIQDSHQRYQYGYPAPVMNGTVQCELRFPVLEGILVFVKVQTTMVSTTRRDSASICCFQTTTHTPVRRS